MGIELRSRLWIRPVSYCFIGTTTFGGSPLQPSMIDRPYGSIRFPENLESVLMPFECTGGRSWRLSANKSAFALFTQSARFRDKGRPPLRPQPLRLHTTQPALTCCLTPRGLPARCGWTHPQSWPSSRRRAPVHSTCRPRALPSSTSSHVVGTSSQWFGGQEGFFEGRVRLLAKLGEAR